MIRIQRVYDPPEKANTVRFLVDRMWPRGIKKEGLSIDGWTRDAAPSSVLRKWFNHDPVKWKVFQKLYRAELDSNPDGWKPILIAAKKDDVTLLFSSRETEHNNAVVLKKYLEDNIRKSRRHGN